MSRESGKIRVALIRSPDRRKQLTTEAQRAQRWISIPEAGAYLSGAVEHGMIQGYGLALTDDVPEGDHGETGHVVG